MYGIPGYDGADKPRRKGMSLKDWSICIGASVLTLLTVWLVMYGVWAITVDTAVTIGRGIFR